MRPRTCPFGLTVLSVSLVLACGKSAEPGASGAATPAAPAEAAPAEAPEPAAAGQPAPPAEAAPPTPAPAADAPPAPAEAIAEAAPPTPVDAAPAEAVAVEADAVAVAPVVPVDAAVAWREVASPSERVDLLNLDAGILAHGPSGYHDLASGALALRAEIEAPNGDIFGVWPKDAWVIESRIRAPQKRRGADADEEEEEIRELRLMRLRGDKRWVPQDYGGEQRFVDGGQHFRKGHRGGLLVRDGETIERISGGADSPTLREHPGELVDFVESATGDFYFFVADGDATFALAPCVEEAGEERCDEPTKLPFGGGWTFTRSAPRQRHSVSIAAEIPEGEASHDVLVHFETGGWKVEEFAAGGPSGLWPTRDGGLWARVGDELLHRAPDGGWRRIAAPAGLSGLSVAISDDLRELWVAGEVGGRPVVFAAASAAQRPAGE
ncbi:MAG: hypothetical protein H6711_17200 [Myxococcales bacterium]|nr:hypothetical protein [Myxococcales bacterium]